MTDTHAEVKKAIEKRLATVSGALPTARENMSYTPTVGTAYQRINFLRGAPDDMTQGRRLTRLQGIAQVSLFYPSPAATGTTAPDAMAASIAAMFKPVLTLTEGGTKIFFTESATISTGFADGDRWVVPVSIPWYADIYG